MADNIVAVVTGGSVSYLLIPPSVTLITAAGEKGELCQILEQAKARGLVVVSLETLAADAA